MKIAHQSWMTVHKSCTQTYRSMTLTYKWKLLSSYQNCFACKQNDSNLLLQAEQVETMYTHSNLHYSPKTHLRSTNQCCRIAIQIIRQAWGMIDSYCSVGKLLSPDKELWLWPSSLCIILFLIVSLRAMKELQPPHDDEWWGSRWWVEKKRFLLAVHIG